MPHGCIGLHPTHIAVDKAYDGDSSTVEPSRIACSVLVELARNALRRLVWLTCLRKRTVICMT
jgi:hypothetical protein